MTRDECFDRFGDVLEQVLDEITYPQPAAA